MGKKAYKNTEMAIIAVNGLKKVILKPF